MNEWMKKTFNIEKSYDSMNKKTNWNHWNFQFCYEIKNDNKNNSTWQQSGVCVCVVFFCSSSIILSEKKTFEIKNQIFDQKFFLLLLLLPLSNCQIR